MSAYLRCLLFENIINTFLQNLCHFVISYLEQSMMRVYVFSYFIFLIYNLLFKVLSLFQEGLDTMISLEAFQLKSYLYDTKKYNTNLTFEVLREGIK